MITDTKRLTPILAILLLVRLSLAAVTKYDMANDIFGIGAVAHGMTGATTTAAGNLLAGPASGAAAAYSFRTPATNEINGLQRPNTSAFFAISIGATGTLNYIGHRGLTGGICGAGSSDATATLPTRCLTGLNTEGRESFWGLFKAGQGMDFYMYAALNKTTANFYSDLGVCDTGAAGNNGCGFHAPDRTVAKFFACNNDDCTHANWQTYIKDLAGGTAHTSDTGVPNDTNFHAFRIQDNGASWDFFIDGVNVGHYTANLPSNTKVLGFYSFTDTGTAGGGLNWSQIVVKFNW